MTDTGSAQRDAKSPGRPKRIVLTAIGSLGDLHPIIALALGLKARGHEVVVATSACYREKVESLGLGCRVLRPDSTWVTDNAVSPHFMHHRWGTFRCLREYVLPVLRESYEDILAASEGADLLVSHSIFYATRLVAETTGIPWVSTIVSPMQVWSALDPPLMPGFPGVSKALHPLGPMFWGPVGAFLKWATRPMAAPLSRLRKELGLPPSEGNPLVDGHSPSLVLALFSGVFAAKQADWPPQTLVCGFPIYDQNGDEGLSPELVRFLDAGPPPIVFTVGFSAVTVAGRFYEESIAAASALGRRAVLVGKRLSGTRVPLPEGVFWCEYAPFSQLFPRAAAVVHAGGIGTSGLALRAGRPMLVVPFAHDQPDNAERLRRLGVARTIPGHRYSAVRATSDLRRLLDDPSYSKRASKVRERMRAEDGVRVACDALEAMLPGAPYKALDRHGEGSVQMADLPNFALRSASNPDHLMEELEKFIGFWIGPRREEYGVPGVVLDGYRLPNPLRRLYSFAGGWNRTHPHVMEEVQIFSIEEHLRSVDQVELTPDGKLIFLDENQGNWTCATLPEGDDPPVWVEDVFNSYGQDKWGLVTDSLSQFLVTFCLRELLAGSKLFLMDKGLEQLFESSKGEAIPLWTEGAYPNWDERFSFYLFHGSVLVGDLGGGMWFGANHEEGIDFLHSQQGEIREISLAQECSWSLDIRPDGSAKVTFPNRFDSSAFAPPGTFDFASVRDQLRAVCTEGKPRSNPWYVTFVRSGQTSCWGQGIDDSRLAAAIFRRALAAVVSKETDFDRLMRESPPQL